MSDQAAGLESALLAHAQRLAEEYLADATKVQEQIAEDSNKQLRTEEERAVLTAKARAERIYQQRVQAAELQLRGELERARWSLIETVLDELPARLAEFARDESRYLPLLEQWLRAGAQAIERGELIVRANSRDLPLLSREWPRLGRESAAGKAMQLSAEPIESSGGVLLASADDKIRFDNTFEGRMERLNESMQRAVSLALIPAGYDSGSP
ncbi:MAG: V-type ATP synthase subunit E [Steroidobacteraceae bacterium]